MALAFGDSVPASIPWDDGHAEPLGLDALLARPAWHADAACREHPELTWFPGHGEPLDEVKAICGRCLVAPECRASAIENRDRHGVWGGVTAANLRRGRIISS